MAAAGSISVKGNQFAFGGDSVISARESDGFSLNGTWKAGNHPNKMLFPGDTVAVKFGNVVVGTTILLADGTWSFSLPPGDTLLNHGVADGNFVVSIGASHNAFSTTTTAPVVVDTGALAPTISLVTDSGVAGDEKTNDATLTGTAEAGATVTVTSKEGFSWTTVADANGIWTLVPTGQPDGNTRFQVYQTDLAGNVSELARLHVNLDTAADPNATATLVADPAGDQNLEYAEVNNVSFTVDHVNGDATAAVTFTDGVNSVTVSGLVDGTYQADLSSLTSGTIHSSMLITDDAGNTQLRIGNDLNLVVCFMPGTQIRTPDGEAAVEALRIGDLVLTADGRAEPIAWIGRQTVARRFAEPARVLPIRIRAGALGVNLPTRDLLVSPDHALLVDGVLVHAAALVNGMSILRETVTPAVFTYYHIELADHSLILAEGVPAETFVDNLDRLTFDNWDEHQALYPQGLAIREMALPRAKSARQVPQASRDRLEARAVALLGGSSVAA